MTVKKIVKKTPPPIGNYSRSKRRLSSPTRSKTFVYLTLEEKDILTQAADRERISISGFVAKAALDAALAILQ